MEEHIKGIRGPCLDSGRLYQNQKLPSRPSIGAIATGAPSNLLEELEHLVPLRQPAQKAVAVVARPGKRPLVD